MLAARMRADQQRLHNDIVVLWLLGDRIRYCCPDLRYVNNNWSPWKAKRDLPKAKM